MTILDQLRQSPISLTDHDNKESLAVRISRLRNLGYGIATRTYYELLWEADGIPVGKEKPMPIPKEARTLIDDVADIETAVTAVDTAIAALPATPLEADLPDIVQIVADISAVAASLRAAVATLTSIVATVRINQ